MLRNVLRRCPQGPTHALPLSHSHRYPAAASVAEQLARLSQSMSVCAHRTNLQHPALSLHRTFASASNATAGKPSRRDNVQQIQQQLPDVITSSQSATTAAELAHKIRRYSPRSPGLRHLITIDRSELYAGPPVKHLTEGKRKHGGRNMTGRITVRHRGGGHRQRYRLVDFSRSSAEVLDQPAEVVRMEYDPNRSAYIALIKYQQTGQLSYILAPQDLKIGSTIQSTRSKELEVKAGNAMTLEYIPTGTILHCVEMIAGQGAKVARSAGTYCQLIGKNMRPGFALVELASKEQRLIPMNCMATIGSLSNPLHKIRSHGKAGRVRWTGRRPRVRAVAMNPVDHPMGGGYNAKGNHPQSPTGVLAKGFKTRNKKKYTSKWIIVKRGGRKSTGQT